MMKETGMTGINTTEQLVLPAAEIAKPIVGAIG
jgi:hypothetical protein